VPGEAVLQPADAASAAGAPSEPAMIEVWRPGRSRDERKPPRRQERVRRMPQVSAAPAMTDAAKPASEPPAPETKRDRPRQHKSHKRERPEREQRSARGQRPERDQRPPRERARERPIDPNSPFAALLELKARLEAAQKNES
jgi:ATP-dependent RNA helicase SUPV3L1/SUV3